jgi:succinate dehydrogenase / fumarate reductase flavoprotein subunit
MAARIPIPRCRAAGLFAGQCAAGINGANRLGGNSLSDLWFERAGEFAAKFANENSSGKRQRQNRKRRA